MANLVVEIPLEDTYYSVGDYFSYTKDDHRIASLLLDEKNFLDKKGLIYGFDIDYQFDNCRMIDSLVVKPGAAIIQGKIVKLLDEFTIDITSLDKEKWYILSLKTNTKLDQLKFEIAEESSFRNSKYKIKLYKLFQGNIFSIIENYLNFQFNQINITKLELTEGTSEIELKHEYTKDDKVYLNGIVLTPGLDYDIYDDKLFFKINILNGDLLEIHSIV